MRGEYGGLCNYISRQAESEKWRQNDDVRNVIIIIDKVPF